MGWARAVLLLAVLLLAGCASDPPARSTPVIGEPTWTTTTSMLPDFGVFPDTYPILIVHTHQGLSLRQQEEQRKHPVSCWMVGPLGDVVSTVLPSTSEDTMAASYAACAPSEIDEATGRIFMDHAEFESWNATSVIAMRTPCGANFQHTTPAMDGVVAQGPMRGFSVHYLANRTFLIDGHLYLRPGQQLKATYTLDYGNPKDNQDASVVFDYGGTWLKSMVAPRDPSEKPVAPRPTVGTGPQAWIPAYAGTIKEILDPLYAQTPRQSGYGDEITQFRLAFVDGNLTDIRVTFKTMNLTTWYVGSRSGNLIHMLGASVAAPDDLLGVGLPTFEGLLGGLSRATILEQVAQGKAADVRWDGGRSLSTRDGWGDTYVPDGTVACDGACDFVLLPNKLDGTMAWHESPLAEEIQTPYQANALTLVTTQYDPSPTEVAFRWTSDPPGLWG